MTRPTKAEAEKDNHEAELARGRCTPTDPCVSCRWYFQQKR